MKTEQTTIHTEHGQKEITISECQWCNNKKSIENVNQYGLNVVHQQDSIQLGDCGSWNIKHKIRLCDTCVEENVFTSANPFERDNGDTYEEETVYGDVDYETSVCDVCGFERVDDQINPVIENIEQNYCMHTSCNCGDYQGDKNYVVCDFCQERLIDRVVPSLLLKRLSLFFFFILLAFTFLSFGLSYIVFL